MDENKQNIHKADTSDYLFDRNIGIDSHMGSLASDRFVDIQPLKNNGSGPFSLIKATRNGKRFALKCLSPKYIGDPTFNLIQEKEFDIGASMDHPNIRATIGIENVTGLGRSIILEYVDGESLEEALKNEHITKDNVRQIVSQIADAIDYIHCKQVVHGDIKPSNILITFVGTRVKLIDFSLSDSDAYVILKNPGGTKNYLAPEMLLPGAKPSVKADLYSFGVVASELARHTGDSELLKEALKLCDQNPEERMVSLDSFRLSKARGSRSRIWNLYSPKLTHVLLLIVLCMFSLIAILWYARFHANPYETAPNPTDNSRIQIVDMEHLITPYQQDSEIVNTKDK